jgi:hypothetical protein
VKKALFSLSAAITAIFVFGGLALARADEFRPTTNYPVVGGYEADPNDFTPSFGHYAWSVTDFYAPTIGEVQETLLAIEEETGRCVIPLNDYRAVQHGSPCIQIVHNVVVGSQLVTAFIPPRFVPKPNRYRAVIFPDFYGSSNNSVLYNLWVDGEPYFAILLAKFVANGKSLVVMTNVGGRTALGYQSSYMYEMAGLFDNLALYWGVDKYRLAAFGGSRGGIVGLTLAQNRIGLDYKFIDIFAHSPVGLQVGTLLANSKVSNFPNLGSIINTFGGDLDAFRDASRAGDVLHGFFGTRDPAEVDQMGILDNAELLRGINLHISWGTGDSYSPASFMVEFEKELLRLGIPARIDYIVGGGHSATNAADLNKAALKCFRKKVGRCSRPKNKRYIYRQSSVKAVLSQKHESPLPFIEVVLPFRLAGAEEGAIEVSAPAGTWFFIGNDAGFSVSGSIDDTEKTTLRFFAGATDMAWQSRFILPSGKEVDGPAVVTAVGPIFGIDDYKIPDSSKASYGFDILLKKKNIEVISR